MGEGSNNQELRLFLNTLESIKTSDVSVGVFLSIDSLAASSLVANTFL